MFAACIGNDESVALLVVERMAIVVDEMKPQILGGVVLTLGLASEDNFLSLPDFKWSGLSGDRRRHLGRKGEE